MIKKLIELAVLSILVLGIVYLFNQLGPLSGDTKTALRYGGVGLKYFGMGVLGIAALAIVAGTIISLAAIILGIPFIKSMTGSDGGFWSRRHKGTGIGAGVSETVNSALKNAFDSAKDWKSGSSRQVEISVEKYPYDSFGIKTTAGDISVSGHELPGARAVIEVLENSDGDTEAFFEDGGITLKTKSGKKSFIGNAKIYLPRKLASLNVESVNGDIKISDFATEAAAAFKGVNGDISVSRVTNGGETSVKTVSGDVEISESQFKSLLTQSISGDVLIKETAAETAVIKTVSGDIDYTGTDIKNPTVKTVSGSINK